jgi:TRAP-type uncharacterized transport system substrate-binding protein
MPAVKKVEAQEPMVFASLTPEEIETIRKAMPELTISQIGSGVYSSLNKTYTSVGMYTFAIGRDDLREDLVYQLVKAIFENQARLVKATSAASETLIHGTTRKCLTERIDSANWGEADSDVAAR